MTRIGAHDYFHFIDGMCPESASVLLFWGRGVVLEYKQSNSR